VRISCYWTKVQLRPTLSGHTDFGISRGKIVCHRLRRIIECPEFDASDRNRRFLQRVVDEMLAACAELSVQHRNIGARMRSALPMLTLLES